MPNAEDVIEAFADLVERAEATTDTRPRAELARFQLQGLAGTLAGLSDGVVPPPVEEALGVLRAHVGALEGGVDRAEGDRLRDKVAAYRVLADDLDLDGERLQALLDRWDASAAPAPRRGRRTGASAITDGQACPVCGETFKRVNKHLSATHPEEWARRKG